MSQPNAADNAPVGLQALLTSAVAAGVTDRKVLALALLARSTRIGLTQWERVSRSLITPEPNQPTLFDEDN